MKRSAGHIIGYLLLGASALCLYNAIILGADTWLASLLAAAVSLGGGYHMLTKLYLDDPEAQREYRAEIERMSFTEALRKYGMPALNRLFDTESLRAFFAKQFGLKGSLSQVCKAMDISNVALVVRGGILTATEGLGRFREDMKTPGLTFSGLWAALAGGIPQLAELGCIDEAACRGLLLAEFGWVDETGNLQASLQESATPPGAPMGLIEAIAAYGEYAVKNLGVTPRFFQTAIRTSQYGEAADALRLVRDGISRAHRLGFVDQAWFQQKFDRYVNDHRSTLWECDDSLSVRDLIRERLIVPESVAGLFQRAIPHATTIQSADVNSPKSNVIAFVEYWEGELRAHPIFVEERYRSTLITIYGQWAEEKRQSQEETRRIENECSARLARLRSELDSRPKEDKAGRAKIEAEMARETEIARNAKERERERILSVKAEKHQQWVRDSSMVTLVTGAASMVCPQQ